MNLFWKGGCEKKGRSSLPSGGVLPTWLTSKNKSNKIKQRESQLSKGGCNNTRCTPPPLPTIVCFLQIVQNIDGFRQNNSQGF